MKHYGISQWVDFARGLTADDDVLAMREHLGEGCADCADIVGFCQSLASVAKRMASGAAPEWVVRRGKTVFPIQAPPRPKRSLQIPVELIYDSFLVPAPTGLRSTWQVGWQALFRAGNCSLDLRVEPELASSRAAVIGQISNHVAPNDRMENVPVFLKSGRSVIAETRSNRFGEFQLEYEQQGRLQLFVYVEDGAKTFQVPLKKFVSDRHAGSERLGLGSAQTKPGSDKQ